jgi:hypothetical protein
MQEEEPDDEDTHHGSAEENHRLGRPRRQRPRHQREHFFDPTLLKQHIARRGGAGERFDEQGQGNAGIHTSFFWVQGQRDMPSVTPAAWRGIRTVKEGSLHVWRKREHTDQSTVCVCVCVCVCV